MFFKIIVQTTLTCYAFNVLNEPLVLISFGLFHYVWRLVACHFHLVYEHLWMSDRLPRATSIVVSCDFLLVLMVMDDPFTAYPILFFLYYWHTCYCFGS